jgi:hypothetical protein
MITLTTAVTFAGETDAEMTLARAVYDNLNTTLEMIEVYGNTVNGVFSPSIRLPAMDVVANLKTGALYVNGQQLTSGGNPAMLTPAQLANVGTALANFQAAVEKEIVALGLAAGTVS